MSNENFDTRLAVFIIWALLFCIFFIFPILILYLDQLLRLVCRKLGCTCLCWRDDVTLDRGERNDNGFPDGTAYDFLRSAQKLEIQRLRMVLMKKCLARFSMRLVVGDNAVMVSRDLEEYQSKYCDGDVDIKYKKQSQEASCCWLDLSDEADAQFTHLSIPHPGYDYNGFRLLAHIDKKKKTAANDTTKYPFFVKMWKCKGSQQQLESPDIATVYDADIHGRRMAPKFCAICLASYQPQDKISWSSNEACTHVFHTDCILKWLATQSKKCSRVQRFSDRPSQDELLGFSMECPCCRQDFVCKLACLCDDEDCEDCDDLESEEENKDNIFDTDQVVDSA